MSDFAISSLRLNNFRCYKDKMIEFSPEINILYGDNAVGKTSILEAVAYLGLSKSFRGAKDKEILKFDEEYFFVKGSFIEKDNKKSEVIISFKEKDKNVRIRPGFHGIRIISEALRFEAALDHAFECRGKLNEIENHIRGSR